MNELENYYQQNAGTAESLGFTQRQDVAERSGAVNIQTAKDDAQDAEDERKEKQDEGGGGAGVAGGLTGKEVLQSAGNRVIKTARGVIQQKVDEIKESVKATRADANKPLLERDAPNPTDAVKNQPNIQPSQLDTAQDLQLARDNLKGRLQNMDKVAQKSVNENIATDTANGDFVPNPASGDLDTQRSNLDVAQSRIQEAERNPATRFEDNNLGADAVEDTTTVARTAQPALGTQLMGVNRSAVNAVNNTTNTVDDAVQTGAKQITSKVMGTLQDKVGVDFGDLTPEEVTSNLSKAVGDSSKVSEAVSGVTDGLETFGAVADALGPIGMIAGLGASLAGIIRGAIEKKQLAKKTADLNTMSATINTTAGMSFGSIAGASLDTSQFRSGGLTGNF